MSGTVLAMPSLSTLNETLRRDQKKRGKIIAVKLVASNALWKCSPVVSGVREREELMIRLGETQSEATEFNHIIGTQVRRRALCESLRLQSKEVAYYTDGHIRATNMVNEETDKKIQNCNKQTFSRDVAMFGEIRSTVWHAEMVRRTTGVTPAHLLSESIALDVLGIG